MLCVLGIIVPYAQFVPWLLEHGLDLRLFVRELFSTRIGAFFGLDVGLSATALFMFIFAERRAVVIRHVWLAVLGTLIVGVSFGLPLFLYMRQRVLDHAAVIKREAA
jgi:uncharacterized protein DUF2834